MERIIQEIEKIERECGEILLEAEHQRKLITSKEGHANFVTDYDKRVQNILKERLLALLPEAYFMGEEDEEKPDVKKGYVFIVDPIDGTTNFIKNYCVSVISVALLKDGETIAGVIYNPYVNQMFTAQCGKGAFCNGEAIHVSDAPLAEGVVLFGTAPYYEGLSKKSFEMAYDYYNKALDVRRSGAAAWDLCCIAAGRAELFFELRLMPWDFAAGALIVREAGGVVTTVAGEELPVGEASDVMATNQAVRADL